MDVIFNLFGHVENAAEGIFGFIGSTNNSEVLYTTIARWIFIFLALFILLKSIFALLKSKSPSEVWAYLHLGRGKNIPITHWENVVGRSKSCDILIEDMHVSRNHGALSRNNKGIWTYKDINSRNGAVVNGRQIKPGSSVQMKEGDEILLGETVCTLFPVSVEEHLNNVRMRVADTRLLAPWSCCIAITIFQVMTVIQLKFALESRYRPEITIAFAGLAALMWTYVVAMEFMKRRGFELEIIAFFLSTFNLAVTATKYPNQVIKQFLAIIIGVGIFFFMCVYLRDLSRTLRIKKFMYLGAALLLIVNLVFGQMKFGASNWIEVPGLGVSVQPSEVVKLAFIWVGAATLEELFDKRNSLVFTVFSVICFGCLALMGDFGTAIIFFVTFLVISFLRSGDFTKLIMIVGVAFVAGLMVLRFKSYVAERFMSWGHVWEYPDVGAVFQQRRTMSAAASGGLIGVGAGNGWLKNVGASETDLVFGLVSEEWGLIVAVLMVLSIITLSIFAYRSIWEGRSTYYTIAACAATSIFLFQTILNVFGSVDLIPLTGVTFPFVSYGGTSMIASWGLLAFVKAADTRQNASFAVSSGRKGLNTEDNGAEGLRRSSGASRSKRSPEVSRNEESSARSRSETGSVASRVERGGRRRR